MTYIAYFGFAQKSNKGGSKTPKMGQTQIAHTHNVRKSLISEIDFIPAYEN